MPTMMRRLSVLLAALLATSAVAQAQSHDAADHSRDMRKTWQAMLARPSLAVAVAFDDDGRLWKVATKDGHLLLSHSDDLGAALSAPIAINPESEAILGDGENRPKLAIRKRDGAQALFLSWTRGLAEPMTGDIRFSRSLDGGETFSAPVTVNDDRAMISHRFEALSVDAQGRIALAWLDKRDLFAAQKAGRKYAGAAVYVAESEDGGQTFPANRKLADHACECCRIALARDADGTPVALWRHVFDGPAGAQIRDFALARFSETPRRATEEGWQLDGCPHHGADLAIDAHGSRHLAWFTGAPGKAGLWYRRIDGAQPRPAMPFGDPERQPGHASILVRGDNVHLAWQEFDGKAMRIRTMQSHDRGERWSAPVTQASTLHAADYPQLIAGRGKVWLAWNSADEGLRLWPLDAPQPHETMPAQ